MRPDILRNMAAVSILLLAMGSSLVAAEQRYPAVVLMLLDAGAAKTSNKAFFFPDLPSDLRVTLDRQAVPIDEAVRLGSDLVRRVPTTEDRWIATKGDVLHVYVIHDEGVDIDLQFQETERQTRFAEDIAVLKQLAGAMKFAKSAAITQREYRLTKTRARLTITAAQGAGDTKATAEKTIITGPAEHLFLSADVPFNDVKEVKYDDTSHQLVSKDTPSKFYAAVDYQIGDLFLPPRGYAGIIVKVLFQPSRTPLSSYGIGLGYRSSRIKIAGFELDKLTPFVAYVRTRQDALAADGTPNTGGGTGEKVVAGLSFNLDNALSWVKKD